MKPSGRYSKEKMKLGEDCVNELQNKIFQHVGSIERAVGIWPWSQSLQSQTQKRNITESENQGQMSEAKHYKAKAKQKA